MTHAIQLVPTHSGVGETSCILGVFHAFERLGLKVAYFKPISQVDEHNKNCNSTLDIINHYYNLSPPPISADKVKSELSDGNEDNLIGDVINRYEKLKGTYDLVIIEGLNQNKLQPYATELNQLIIRALGADIILVSDSVNQSSLICNLEFAASPYGGIHHKRVLGAIINQVNGENALDLASLNTLPILNDSFKLIAAIQHNEILNYPRTLDVLTFLEGNVLFKGEINNRRISKYDIIAETLSNAIKRLKVGRLIFIPSDRDDVLMAATFASNDQEIAGIILTGETEPSNAVLNLCKSQIESTKLPVIHVKKNSWEIARVMEKFNTYIPFDDTARIKSTMVYFADFIDKDWCQNYLASNKSAALSPAAFKYQIVKRAQSSIKHIILPEGDEPRTVEAAIYCCEKHIAECTLLADPNSVQKIIDAKGLSKPNSLTIIDPQVIRHQYIDRLIELRKHKGMNETLAEKQLSDNVMLGTMMLEASQVDGLVSGAVHTTANTIRPPLQIIKTDPKSKLVSSAFFMCLSEQVYVYGDCAINPNPNAEQLADIAIQSTRSARAFGLKPKVAMISYSTGESGSGDDVDKVREATKIVKQKHPEIVIDGPLQYDAATIQSVAQSKAPNSPVAGQANVFIFPDLNTGNTTYKAVQRSANAISIGPMLQGMRKPVNDLSRGALVEDIIYTIAITAIQSQDM